MKARDYFAGLAMKHFMSEAHLLTLEVLYPGEEKLKKGEIIARRSYEMADYMLKASVKEN